MKFVFFSVMSIDLMTIIVLKVSGCFEGMASMAFKR